MRPLLPLCALVLATSASAAIPTSQRDALIAIYDATAGPNWNNSAGWKGAAGTECDWFGVDCNFEQTHVLSLQLHDNNLVGTIPSSIGQLSEIRSIYLSRNQLDGRIPATIGNLKKLETLEANGTQLDGPLPSELSTLPELRYLDLSYGEFTGAIPNLSLTKLEYLSLAVNKLTGSVPLLPQTIEHADFTGNELAGPIPAHLASLQALVYLRLAYNQFTGGIPAQLGQLKTLETLDLYNNPDLGGTIPRSLGDLTRLKFLNLGKSGLTGTIPAEIYQLAALEELWLGENALEGSISSDIGRLQNLVKLGLNGNRLSGPIPVALTTLTKLETLDLLVNDLTGPIPSEIGRLQNLAYIDLAANELTGTIPPQFGDLTNLTFLSLYENDLEGPIPSELGRLTELSILFLASNRLTGPIPESLRNLRKLTQLGLNGNQLSGQLPTWIGELTTLQQLVLHENRFEGTIPASLSNLEDLVVLDLGTNFLTGPLPDFSRFAKMGHIYFNSNELTGRIPESIGVMRDVMNLDFGSNQLTGPLPREIGNLTRVEYISFADNNLEGPIPAEIGQLRSAYNISLHFNRFSGTIPPQIGDLAANLRFLGLGYNALRGPIPGEITKLTALDEAASDFSQNMLYTSSAAVREFVNRKQGDGDFELTQTVAPANVQIAQTTDRSATLTWTPIRYSDDPGGYQVTVSTSSGGAPVAVATTPSKDASSIVVRNLEPSTRYFFTVSTVTHPHPYQKNVLVSDPAAAQQATTGARVIAPAEVVISERTEGLVQVDGVEVAGDRFAVSNFGDLGTTVTLERDGDFFTAEPMQFSLAGGATQVVTLKSSPQPPGTYYGEVVVRGAGVDDEEIAYVVLLSVRRPEGSVIAEPVSSTVELAGAPGSDSAGIAQFRNVGTVALTGIVVSDQPWVVPDPQPITIAPGAIGSVSFRVVRSKRPADAGGALTANLSLVYVDGGTSSGIGAFNGTSGVSVSKVTIIDTTKPPVTPGSIPTITAGELPLYIPGVASLGNVRSDVSLVNAFSGNAIGDLRLYFSTGSATNVASLQPLGLSESINLVNVAGNIYGASNAVGTLQIRTREWSSIGTDAKVTAVTPAGTYSGAIPVFRGDRSARTSEQIHLAGLAAGGDLFLQETFGTDSVAAVQFFDAAGNQLGSTRTENVSAFALRELRGVIPANAAAATVTSGGSGALVAYARITNAATGDSWSVVDWARFYGYLHTDAVRVPFADGRGPSVGGKRRAVRNSATGDPQPAATRFATDLALFNPSASEARATLQLLGADGTTTERTVTVAPRATIALRDVAATAPTTTAHVVVVPVRGSLAVSARSHAGTYGTAVPVVAASQGLRLGQSQVFSSLEDSSTFKTAYGLVETSGAPVTVRARILIGETYSLVTATTTRTFDLGPRQQVYLPELLRSFAGAARDALGDLHDLTLELEVTGGSGSVVPFLIVTDGGTGDTVMKMQ
jgi:Leucine-rich repeat (LRR) protein